MSTSHSSLRRRAAASALLALFASVTASAQTWSNPSANTFATAYLWSSAGNWSPAAPVSGSATALQFNLLGSGSLFLNNDTAGVFQLNSLRFTGSGSGSFSLGRSGAGSASSLAFEANAGINPVILFDSTSTGAKTISSPLALNADTTVTRTSTGTVSAGNLQLGALSGSGSLIVDFGDTSTGAVLLTGTTNTHASTRLVSGRLVVGNATALGSGPLTLSGGVFRTTTGASGLSFANTLNLAGNTTIFETASGAANTLAFTGGGSIQGTNATRVVTLGKTGTTLTLGGAFSGAGNGLEFAGTGNVNLGSGAADSAANTFTGATTVSGSGVALSLNKADGTHALAGNLAVSNGSVAWARSHQIADTASLTQSGGSVTLGLGLAETVNATTLNAGAFTVSKDASYSTGSLAVTTAGTAGSRAVGGLLDVGSGGLSIAHDGTASTRNAFTLYDSANAGSGVLRLAGGLTFTNATAAATKVQITRSSGTGYIDLAGGDRAFTINDGAADDDLEITVRITNGGLVKNGAGTLAFLNTASDYAGDTVINQGTIRANSAAQTLANNSTYVLADTAGVTLDLNGNSQAIGGLSGGGAAGGLVSLGAGTLAVGNNNASTSFAGSVTGTGGLTKTGTGTLTLSSDLEYTGATLVSGGKLVVNGLLASSGVTLDGADAVLGGSGRINGLTLAQGTLAPGNSPGALTVDGSVSFGAASVFSVEAASASSFDQLFVEGASSTITIADGASLLLTGFDALPALAGGTEFILIGNNSENTISGSFLGYGEGHTFTLGANTFTTSYQLGGVGGNDFGFVVASAIPEPAAFSAFAGLAALALATQRRRRT